MTLKKFICTLSVLLITSLTVSAQDRLTREEYIQKYKNLAIEHMDIYGIPASIKMAQALFESDNGNSRLAREANNHFGIKCKSDWTGETIDHDDDAKGECFRKYSSVEESYKDHSEFLDKSERYQDLFKLDPMDYKGWAEGLKKAGYATNPMYAAQLIKIIEDNKLYLLDQGKDLPNKSIFDIQVTEQQPVEETQPMSVTEKKPADVVDVDNYTISVEASGGRHAVYNNNGSKFVVASEGDNFGTIANEFGISIKKLMKYNDLPIGATLRKGDMVYIKPKNKRSENGKLIHIAKEGETMHYISQLYGIKLNNLYNINRRPKDSEVKEGQQIRLM